MLANMALLPQHPYGPRQDEVILAMSARICVTRLEALKMLVTKGSKRSVLIEVIVHVERSIFLLEEWIADVSEGQQTQGNGIVQMPITFLSSSIVASQTRIMP